MIRLNKEEQECIKWSVEYLKLVQRGESQPDNAYIYFNIGRFNLRMGFICYEDAMITVQNETEHALKAIQHQYYDILKRQLHKQINPTRISKETSKETFHVEWKRNREKAQKALQDMKQPKPKLNFQNDMTKVMTDKDKAITLLQWSRIFFTRGFLFYDKAVKQFNKCDIRLKKKDIILSYKAFLLNTVEKDYRKLTINRIK